MVNTPTVTFANAVTQVGMPQANLTAQLLGLGGATADSYNRLSVNTPAVLLNNAGAGIEATVNKAAPANDASFAFKTNWSARALIGLLGSDDFSFKVSPDGSAFYEAIRIDRASGRVEMPEPVVLPALDAVPTPPPTGKLAVYARDRAGAGWLDVQRPLGAVLPAAAAFRGEPDRDLGAVHRHDRQHQRHAATAVGTVSTPTLATTNLSTSMRRWRVTSAATADAAAEERSAGWVCWRGNADGLGGFTCEPALAGDAAGDRHGLLRPLRLDDSAGHDPDVVGRGELHRHRLPARHPHELATRAERCFRRAHAHRSRGEFPGREHDERPDSHALRGPEQQRDRRPGGRGGQRAVVEAMLDTDIPAATQLLSPRIS